MTVMSSTSYQRPVIPASFISNVGRNRSRLVVMTVIPTTVNTFSFCLITVTKH